MGGGQGLWAGEGRGGGQSQEGSRVGEARKSARALCVQIRRCGGELIMNK